MVMLEIPSRYTNNQEIVSVYYLTTNVYQVLSTPVINTILSKQILQLL